MHIDIQARDFFLTAPLRNFVLRRLNLVLRYRYEQIHRIQVRLGDINGPRGGDDKRCRIQVVLPGAGTVIIEDIAADMYVAIDRAVERMGYSVTRRLGRRRDKGQRTRRLPALAQDDAPAALA